MVGREGDFLIIVLQIYFYPRVYAISRHKDTKTQRHIFSWYFQLCVTKLDVGVFALQLFLSPSLIKFCSIYTLAWETDLAYYCFRTSNIITNYCNTCCLTFWYMTSLLLNILLGFEQKTSPLLSYNREVRIRLWRVGLFDFGSGSGRVWPKSSGFGFGFGYCAYYGLKANSLVILCNSILCKGTE